MTVSPSLVAILRVLTAEYGLTASTAVAVPPSSLDPWPAEMAVRTGNREIHRSYDPELVQP